MVSQGSVSIALACSIDIASRKVRVRRPETTRSAGGSQMLVNFLGWRIYLRVSFSMFGIEIEIAVQ